MKKHRAAVFLPLVLAPAGLGLYLWYLHYVHYPVNWALVAFLTVICLSVSFLFVRGKN